MAGKRANGKAKKNGAGKRKRFVGRRGLNKAEQKQVVALAKQAVADVKETKYVNNFTLTGQGTLNDYETITETSPGVDLANSRMLHKLQVHIPKGDDYKSRDGDKVALKNIQLRFRVKPQDAYDFIAAGNAPGNDWFSKPEFVGHILRVDKTASLTAASIDQCIRRPGENWMDTRQTGGRQERKQFQIVHKFKLDCKYRHTVGLDSSTIPPEMYMIKIPEITIQSVNMHVNKPMLFNDSSGDEPLKYEYYLFMTWRNYLQDSYTVTTFPAYINLWTSYTFLDL